MPDVTSADSDAAYPRWQRSVWLIALGAGMASFSMNFWVPFLPLYMRGLGVEGEAGQLFWTAVALSSNGVFRMIGGPLWGVLSDRYGRKPMFVRSLYAATITALIAAFAVAPWQVALAMACQGFFSGFIPAAVALTSVSVPPPRLTSGLGIIQGAQYTGGTIGPAVGALIAGWVDLRGAILIGALLPAAAATIVLLAVPRDQIAPRTRDAVVAGKRRPWSLPGNAGSQLLIGLALYFMLFLMMDLVRTAAPAALAALEGEASATRATGIAFTVSGLASVAGAVGLARLVGRPGHFRWSLTAVVVVCALSHIALGLAPTLLVFTAAYGVASLARGAMLPATNTVIAASVPPERRGAVFGIAAGVQALAFIVGPMSAALFATFSLDLGFVVLGLALLATAALTLSGLREPELQPGARPSESREPAPRQAPA